MWKYLLSTLPGPEGTLTIGPFHAQGWHLVPCLCLRRRLLLLLCPFHLFRIISSSPLKKMKVKHAGNNFITTKLPSQLAPASLPDLTTHQGGGLYPGHSAKFLARPSRISKGNQAEERETSRGKQHSWCPAWSRRH